MNIAALVARKVRLGHEGAWAPCIHIPSDQICPPDGWEGCEWTSRGDDSYWTIIVFMGQLETRRFDREGRSIDRKGNPL